MNLRRPPECDVACGPPTAPPKRGIGAKESRRRYRLPATPLIKQSSRLRVVPYRFWADAMRPAPTAPVTPLSAKQ